MTKTAVALYDTKNTAQEVITELTKKKFRRDTIQLKSNQDQDTDAALTSVGLPRSNAEAYQEGVRRGGALVIVTTDEKQINSAVDIMERYDSVDLQERIALWRSEGWRESAVNHQAQTQNAAGETAIPVVEEQMRVDKRQVEQGGVRIRTRIVERPVEETVTLHKENVEVERRPVNRAATGADFDTFQEGTMEFAETSEEAVVDKQAHIAEEVVVHKETSNRQQTVCDTVRHTEVDVEQLDDPQVDDASFTKHRQEFQNHYQTNYAQNGSDYDTYEPAYRYGYMLHSSDGMRDRSWKNAEGEARKGWEKDHRGTWDRFQNAVHKGWESVSR